MDDGVNAQNFQLYEELLKGVNNSNGCPIKATFFVSGDDTDYNLVKGLYESGKMLFFFKICVSFRFYSFKGIYSKFCYSSGHEIADHSVTHKLPEEWWGESVSE